MGSGGKTGSNRKMGEAIAFMVMFGVVGLEMYFAFKKWWVVFDKWFQRNPVTPTLLILGLAMGPISGFLWLQSSGPKIGDEAEEIGRGMRR